MEKEIDNLIITPPESIEESASRAYTDWLRSVETNIPEELKRIIPRKAAKEYYNKLCEIYKTKKFDRAADPFKRLVSVLTKAFPDFEEEFKKSGLDNLPFTDENLKALLEFLAIWVNKLPAFNELDYTFLKYISEQFDKYKSSSDYLTRLVHKRLEAINPSILDKSLSTRLLILKQFIHQFGCGKVIEKTVDKKKRVRIADPYETRRTKKIEDRPKGKKQINPNSYYSESIEQMCINDFHGSYEEMSQNLSETEFEVLLLDKKCNFAKIANALASAYFSAQRKTREYLYIFAIAFEMKFNMEDNESSKRHSSSSAKHDWMDIQKNLFFDFYNYNLLNEVKNPKTEESFVDGYGINWRNFVEVCYIYFINKPNITPVERFYKAVTTWSDKSYRGNFIDGKKYTPSKHTLVLKECTLKVLLEMSEDEFIEEASFWFLTKKKPHTKKKDSDTPDSEKTEKDSDTPDAKKTKKIADPVSAPVAQNSERTTTVLLDNAIIDASTAIISTFSSEPRYNECNDWDFLSCFGGKKDPTAIVDDEKAKLPQTILPLYISSTLEGCIKRFVAACASSETSRMNLLSVFANYIFAAQYKKPADKKLSCFDKFFDYFAKEAEITIPVTEIVVTIKTKKDEYGKETKVETHTETEAKRTFRGANELLIYAGYQEIYCGNLFDMLLIYQTFRKCCMGWGYTEK